MASKYLKRFQVPNNFENILSDFAKEILRNQPKDIIDFGIEYFKGLESNTKLDYKDKGENRPENYKRPENQEPNIINAPNNLEISKEDKNRLQRSMDKIERINKEPEHIQESEKEEHIENKNVVIQEKEEHNIEQIEQHEEHEEQEVKVSQQVTVITKTKETVIRNGEVIKNEEKVEQKVYNNGDESDKEISEVKVFKKTEESPQQIEGRYNEINNEENKDEYGNWFLRHSMNKENGVKLERPKEEPQEEFARNEMGYKTWFENNSEGGSVLVQNSNEIKQGDDANKNEAKAEIKNEKHDDGYADWFLRHSKEKVILNKKSEEIKTDFNAQRYEGDYQTWFDNHSKITKNKI